MKENAKVILKLACPICGCTEWKCTENHSGEFICAACETEHYCECMIAVAEDVTEEYK